MAKKTQGTDTKQHDIAAPPENRPLDKSIVRSIKTRLSHFKCCSCVWDFVCRSVYDDSESAGIRR